MTHSRPRGSKRIWIGLTTPSFSKRTGSPRTHRRFGMRPARWPHRHFRPPGGERRLQLARNTRSARKAGRTPRPCIVGSGCATIAPRSGLLTDGGGSFEVGIIEVIAITSSCFLRENCHFALLCLNQWDEFLHFIGEPTDFQIEWSRLLGCSIRSPPRNAHSAAANNRTKGDSWPRRIAEGFRKKGLAMRPFHPVARRDRPDYQNRAGARRRGRPRPGRGE